MTRQLRRLFRTATFRLAIAQVGMFTVFAFALLFSIYFTTAGQLTRDADRAADIEFAALSQIYSEGGFQRLNEEVIDRIAAGGPGLYCLANQDGRVVSGSFAELPETPTAEPRRIVFKFDAPVGPGPDNGRRSARTARGRIGRLLNGPILFVARDMGDANAIVGRISSAVWTGGAVGLLFSIVAGYSAARQAARRADMLSKTARDVMAGDLSRRAPVLGVGDEFDDLARDLNAMLSKIQDLITASRTAGDAIAHDLRSPLVRMRQTMEHTLDRPADVNQDREALRKAMEETEWILDTFDSLLQLANARSADCWQFQSADISALADDLTEFFGPAAEDSGLTFEAEVDQGVSVDCEPRLVALAAANLIENALKYTPSGGRVRFALRRERDGGAEISVADDGPGVPQHERERVKERFVRLDPGRTTGGSGLGLAMVVAVAEAHEGVLSLEDGLGAPGGPGLTARLVLPASPSAKARAA